jgi:hypothetical protein
VVFERYMSVMDMKVFAFNLKGLHKNRLSLWTAYTLKERLIDVAYHRAKMLSIS